MKHVEPLFRPPAEANSSIFQVAYGCPHNQCRFCGMYKTVLYRLRDRRELLAEIAEEGRRNPNENRVFLADGDVMALPFDLLDECLAALRSAFPRLARVNVYANGSSIAGKSDEQLRILHEKGLHTLYMGLESGSQKVLDLFGKTEQVEEMVASVRRAQDIGLHCSVMALIGLGGKDLRNEHVAGTIQAINRMEPRLLSMLRFIRIPGLPTPKAHREITEREAVEELRDILAGLELRRTVFRANHTSNPIPLGGRLPADKTKLIDLLNQEVASGDLDRSGPGPIPIRL